MTPSAIAATTTAYLTLSSKSLASHRGCICINPVSVGCRSESAGKASRRSIRAPRPESLERADSLPHVAKVLVTGMSGTGKSTALVELAKRGFAVVDTDEGGWSEWSDSAGGYVWREDLIEELLARDHRTTLYVSGTVSNQGLFYPRFDAIVLLSAPAEVLLRRIAARVTNDYGKAGDERELVLRHLAEVEPLLRATCTHEIDATLPLAEVVERLVEVVERLVELGS